ncbi:MAG: hypothetical protein KAG19_04880 [Methylococcales bacterium]|nr:hypothetical protein [Methylococcales bacterium]
MRKLLIVCCLWVSVLNAAETTEPEKEEKLELPPFHHVVGVKPSEGREIDEKLKLGDEGELVCTTCHGLKDIDKKKVEDVDSTDKDFLHGGPYRPLTNFCYRCHNEKSNTRENIHILLDEDGEIKKKQCEYCHEEVPDRDAKLEIKDLKLRIPVEKLCFGCHLKDPHFNSVEHQVEPAEEGMIKHLKEMRKKQNIFIPLSEKGEVMCVSCHTPHQRGVIDVNKPAGKQVKIDDLKEGVTYKKHPWGEVFEADKADRMKALNKDFKTDFKVSYQRIEHEALLRLPAKNGELCLSCHTFDQ